MRRQLPRWSAAGGHCGERLCVLTHAPMGGQALPAELAQLALGGADGGGGGGGTTLATRSVALHELSSAEDLSKLLAEYFALPKEPPNAAAGLRLLPDAALGPQAAACPRGRGLLPAAPGRDSC